MWCIFEKKKKRYIDIGFPIKDKSGVKSNTFWFPLAVALRSKPIGFNWRHISNESNFLVTAGHCVFLSKVIQTVWNTVFDGDYFQWNINPRLVLSWEFMDWLCGTESKWTTVHVTQCNSVPHLIHWFISALWQRQIRYIRLWVLQVLE